jgi:hypothetical protein
LGDQGGRGEKGRRPRWNEAWGLGWAAGRLGPLDRRSLQLFLILLGGSLPVRLQRLVLFSILFFFLLLALLAAQLFQVGREGLGFLSLLISQLVQGGAAWARLLFEGRSLRGPLPPAHFHESLGEAVSQSEEQTQKQPTAPAWGGRGGVLAALP